MKPRVFIGSSSEGLATAKYVRKTLEKDFDCVLWNDGTVFGLNISYLDSLLKAGSMFDFGILVATKDDKTKSRDKGFDTPRDNVIFEFGLFMGRLGKFRTLILREKGAKLPSDMAGITVSEYVGGKSAAAAASLKKQLDTLRTHIKERSQLQELGLLPSTGTAMGFYTSFLQRICDYLRPGQNETINGVVYSSFEVQVVVPRSLQRNMQVRAADYYKAAGFAPHTFVPPPAMGREIKTQVAPDKKTPGKLLICDLPTTLTAVFDAIEMYLSKGYTGKSKEQELIEARELSNFVAVVKAKVAEDPFNQKLVKFIEE